METVTRHRHDIMEPYDAPFPCDVTHRSGTHSRVQPYHGKTLEP